MVVLSGNLIKYKFAIEFIFHVLFLCMNVEFFNAECHKISKLQHEYLRQLNKITYMHYYEIELLKKT